MLLKKQKTKDSLKISLTVKVTILKKERTDLVNNVVKYLDENLNCCFCGSSLCFRYLIGYGFFTFLTHYSLAINGTMKYKVEERRYNQYQRQKNLQCVWNEIYWIKSRF